MVLNKKYKANTLPEVLIAIVIISFTSAFGVSIYSNIQESTQPFFKLKASNLVQKILIETEQKQSFFDESFKEGDFSVKKSVTRMIDYQDCIILKITVRTSTEKQAAVMQKIIHVD